MFKQAIQSNWKMVVVGNNSESIKFKWCIFPSHQLPWNGSNNRNYRCCCCCSWYNKEATNISNETEPCFSFARLCISLPCSALPGIPIRNSKLMRTNFSVHTSVIHPFTVLCLSARLDNVNEPAREWYNLFTICCYFFCNISSLIRRNNLISIICRQTVRY